MKRFACLAGMAILFVTRAISPVSAQVGTASTGSLDFGTDKVLIGVGAAAAGAVIVGVLIYKSAGKQTVSGCVNAGASGMSLISNKDQPAYALSGTMTGIVPGNHMTLHIKKIKAKGSSGQVWVPEKVSRVFGICHP